MDSLTSILADIYIPASRFSEILGWGAANFDLLFTGTLHNCPFQEEINYNFRLACNCDTEKTQECIWGI